MYIVHHFKCINLFIKIYVMICAINENNTNDDSVYFCDESSIYSGVLQNVLRIYIKEI